MPFLSEFKKYYFDKSKNMYQNTKWIRDFVINLKTQNYKTIT